MFPPCPFFFARATGDAEEPFDLRMIPRTNIFCACSYMGSLFRIIRLRVLTDWLRQCVRKCMTFPHRPLLDIRRSWKAVDVIVEAYGVLLRALS